MLKCIPKINFWVKSWENDNGCCEYRQQQLTVSIYSIPKDVFECVTHTRRPLPRRFISRLYFANWACSEISEFFSPIGIRDDQGLYIYKHKDFSLWRDGKSMWSRAERDVTGFNAREVEAEVDEEKIDDEDEWLETRNGRRDVRSIKLEDLLVVDICIVVVSDGIIMAWEIAKLLSIVSQQKATI